jgi:hypothetical protein
LFIIDFIPLYTDDPSFRKYVIKSLERLHQKADLQGELMANILNVIQNRGTADAVVQAKFKFPLLEMSEIDEWEEKLKNDSDFNQLVRIYFVSIKFFLTLF